MAQGMPHLPRDKNPVAFEDEETERIRLGLGGVSWSRGTEADHRMTRRELAVMAVVGVVLGALLLFVLGVL